MKISNFMFLLGERGVAWRKILTCVVVWIWNCLFARNRDVSLEVEDRKTEMEMEEKSGEVSKCRNSKIRYSRSSLLSLIWLEYCQALPDDFEPSVLSEYNAAMAAPEMQRSSTALMSCSSSHDTLKYIRCDLVGEPNSRSERWNNQPLRLTSEYFLNGYISSDSKKSDDCSRYQTRVPRTTPGIIEPKPQGCDQVLHRLRKGENAYRPPHACKVAKTKSEDDPSHEKQNSVVNFGAKGVMGPSSSSKTEQIQMLHSNKAPSSAVRNSVNTAAKSGFLGFDDMPIGAYVGFPKFGLKRVLCSYKVPSSAVGTFAKSGLLESDDMPFRENVGFLTPVLIVSGAYGRNYKAIKTSIIAADLEMDKNGEKVSISHECMLDKDQESKLTSVADNVDKDDSKATICLPDEEDLLSVDNRTTLKDASQNSTTMQVEICLPDEDNLITLSDLIGDDSLTPPPCIDSEKSNTLILDDKVGINSSSSKPAVPPPCKDSEKANVLILDNKVGINSSSSNPVVPQCSNSTSDKNLVKTNSRANSHGLVSGPPVLPPYLANYRTCHISVYPGISCLSPVNSNHSPQTTQTTQPTLFHHNLAVYCYYPFPHVPVGKTHSKLNSFGHVEERSLPQQPSVAPSGPIRRVGYPARGPEKMQPSIPYREPLKSQSGIAK